MRKGAVLLAFLTAGCATTTASDWRRVDGASIAADQFEVDKAICAGERDKAAVGHPDNGDMLWQTGVANVYKGCMAQRGYLRRG